MRSKLCGNGLFCALACGLVQAQDRPAPGQAAELRLHLVFPHPGKTRGVPAVIWLEPLPDTPALTFTPRGRYTLLQKNRTFLPHLQVIPVGSVVQFPNADPFFHNVFSLFDGKRFDLGLYEAGSSKSVTFAREGVSYIFCNIHPEMSAVIITLSTPLFAIADASDAFALHGIPPGDYRIHFWIEGVPHSDLAALDRRLHLSPRTLDLGAMEVSFSVLEGGTHKNKFGEAYPPETQSPY